MKKLFALALCFAMNANLQALSTKTSIKIATLCGDCGEPCGKLEKPEKPDTI
jgi:hypothetical protein